MKTLFKFIAAAMLVLFSASCSKEDPASADFAAEGYSFRVKEGDKYVEASRTIQVKEASAISMYIMFEKHPGNFVPANYGEVNITVTKSSDSAVAKVQPIRTGTLYCVGISGVAKGKTNFTVEVNEAGSGKLILRKNVDVNVI